MTQTIFMVGARGAGKTTVGKALAQKLGYFFTDTDAFMQQTTHMSVAEVVAKEGWSGFRQRESAALQTVSEPGTVIATGGGMVLEEVNRIFMRSQGIVFYLRAPAETLAHRLQAYPEDEQRPTLTGKPIAEEMMDILMAREALYQDAAHYVLDATQEPQLVVKQILALLQPEPALAEQRHRSA